MHQLCLQSNLIEVRRAENRGRGGRGVFARQDIPAQTLVERVPVLLVPRAQIFGGSSTQTQSATLSWYVFSWKGFTRRDYVALALGYGSIYNHSPTPNLRYECETPDLLEFHALRNIAAGEELFIDYTGGIEHSPTHPLGFDVEP